MAWNCTCVHACAVRRAVTSKLATSPIVLGDPATLLSSLGSEHLQRAFCIATRPNCFLTEARVSVLNYKLPRPPSISLKFRFPRRKRAYDVHDAFRRHLTPRNFAQRDFPSFQGIHPRDASVDREPISEKRNTLSPFFANDAQCNGSVCYKARVACFYTMATFAAT